MTKESIERAKEFSGHQAQKHFPMSFHESERKTATFIGRIAYLQGMQDPDAGKDSLAVVNLIHADEKIRELQVAYKGLLEENQRLREALNSIRHSIVGYRGNGEILIEIDKALSSGGE